MAQHDYVIDNGPGLAVRTDFNAAMAALSSCNSGTVEPVVKVPGMLWFDTSIAGPPILKVRDQANSTWVTMATASGGNSITLDPATGDAALILDAPIANSNLLTGSRNGLSRW